MELDILGRMDLDIALLLRKEGTLIIRTMNGVLMLEMMWKEVVRTSSFISGSLGSMMCLWTLRRIIFSSLRRIVVFIYTAKIVFKEHFSIPVVSSTLLSRTQYTDTRINLA